MRLLQRTATLFMGCGLLLAGALTTAGCDKGTAAKPADPAKTTAPAEPSKLEDAWGFSLTPPTGWSEAAKDGFKVPGDLRYALVPQGYPKTSPASVTVFLQKPNVAYTASKLLEMSVAGIKKSDASASVKVQEVRQVARMTAMWMEATGPGTGGALGPGGTVPTTQIWAAIPRGNDVLVLLFTCPDGAVAAQRPAFDAIVKSLTVTGEQNAEQKASK